MNDVRVGLRTLRNTPAFSATAILTLALGIGLATAVFTVADALLLRPLPVQDQDRLVVLWERAKGFTHFPLQLTEARGFARHSRTLEHAAFVAYEGAWPKPVMTGDQISRLRRALASGWFFGVLGSHAMLGRALHPEDDAPGAAPVLVLSYSAWRQRFGGDPHLVGRQVLMYDDGVTYRIVGVMPQGLDYPRGAELWVPLTPARDSSVADVDVIGRLASGTVVSLRGLWQISSRGRGT